jgi:signal transduction histidine kinase
MSIRSRLILLVLSVLLPALAAAAWLIVSTYHGERERAERNLRDSTRALSLLVDRELTQRAAIAKLLSLSRAFDAGPDLTGTDLRAFEEQARRALEDIGGWVVLTSERGELLNTRFAPGDGRPEPERHTGSLRQQSAVLPLAPRSSDGGFEASIVQPVVRNGRTVFNVAVKIRPSDLQKIIDQQAVPPDWVASLIDNRGTIVARNRDPATYVGRSASQAFKALIAGRRDGVVESTTLDGVPVLTSFNTSPQGWTYLVGMPRSQLAAGLPAAVSKVVLATLLLTALALLGALWVSRRISGPIYSLKQAAAELGRGEPVSALSTGIVECDDVGVALAEASRSSREAREHLEQQVALAVERTREAEQRVSRSQRVEALGRLTGGVAHDFNNLLGVISNSAYLIQRKTEDSPGPSLQTPLAAILRAVEVGSRLTQHLLRFAGRQPVTPQTIDLLQHLPDVQDLLKAVVGSSVQVTVAVAPTTRPITVDSSELELALINLALNARDAMPAGGRLQVEARNALPQEFPELQAQALVVISVRDTGTGIEPALLARIFEPFFTTKAVGKGTGLGLSQVHGFCTQAGGTVHLTSRVGEGTTVALVLPASPESAALRAGTVAPDSGLALSGCRVLMVEDNEALGEVTAALLDAFGCCVDRARSGEEGLEKLRATQGAYDVVLSDVVMPGTLDGVALARAVREPFPHLPVVLISGYARSLQGDHEFEVLRKPCSPQDLAQALRKAVGGRD